MPIQLLNMLYRTGKREDGNQPELGRCLLFWSMVQFLPFTLPANIMPPGKLQGTVLKTGHDQG